MLILFLRAVLLYLFILFILRMTGKRQIADLQPFDLIITMAIADLAATAIADTDIPLLYSVVPILALYLVQQTVAHLSLKSGRFRAFVCGSPLLLVREGVLQENIMRQANYTVADLSDHLRAGSVFDLKTVQYAILETNGNLSVFPYPKEKPASAKDAGVQASKQYLPLTIVSDGRLLRDNLQKAGKNEDWLRRVLREKQAELAQTYLLTVDGSDHILFYRKEG